MLKNIRKISFLSLIWILFYLCLFSFLLYNSFNYLDPDLGWHLKVGEQVINEKSVPSFEHYNYTLAGKKWVDHEWLLNAATFAVYDNFGYITLNIIFALLVIIILIILNVYTQKYFLNHKQGITHIMFFQSLGVLAMSPHLGVRMQEFTLLYLLLLFIILNHYAINHKVKTLWWLLPLMLIWANTHGSFLIGVFILLFWITIKVLEIIIKKYNYFENIIFLNYVKLKKLPNFLLFSLLAIVVTLFTPYSLKLYSFLKDYADTFYMKHIAEWLPAYSFPVIYYQLIYAAIIATVLIIVLCSLLKYNIKKTKLDLWLLALTILFLMLAFKSRRHFPLFFIASFPLTIYYTSKHLIIPEKIFKLFKKNIVLNIFISAALMLVSFYFLANIHFTNTPFSSPNFCRDYPCTAIKYLKSNPEYLKANIFNHYGWGGYMIWQWPGKKIFIDGRLPQYKIAGQTMLEEYYDFFNEEKVAAKLNQYNIELVLLPIIKKVKLNWFNKYILGLNEEKINNSKNYLKEYLGASSQWKNVYNDTNSIIYFKNGVY